MVTLDRPFIKALAVLRGLRCHLSVGSKFNKIGGNCPDMTIAVYWDVYKQLQNKTKQTILSHISSGNDKWFQYLALPAGNVLMIDNGLFLHCRC